MFVSLLAVFGVLSSVTAAAVSSKKAETFLNAAKQFVNDKEGLIDLYNDYTTRKSKSTLYTILEGLEEYLEESKDEYDNANSKKHVLTILSDDQGYADIGYIDSTIISPTVNTLAAKGIKFNSFYVQSTCSPTRASLLTGRDIGVTGLQDGAILPGESRTLPLSLQTAGNYFSNADYDTYFIGKWHLGSFHSPFLSMFFFFFVFSFFLSFFFFVSCLLAV
jgi:hypothetical protein